MDNGRILWVDDEVETLKPHIIFLESKGFKVLTATNGADALVIIAENSFESTQILAISSVVFFPKLGPLSNLKTNKKLQ